MKSQSKYSIVLFSVEIDKLISYLYRNVKGQYIQEKF